MSRQTVQTQSAQGLHCLPMHLCILSLSEFLDMLNESCGTVQGKLKLGGGGGGGGGTSCFCLQVVPSDKLSSLAYF